jgi:hypothetical protein
MRHSTKVSGIECKSKTYILQNYVCKYYSFCIYSVASTVHIRVRHVYCRSKFVSITHFASIRLLVQSTQIF